MSERHIIRHSMAVGVQEHGRDEAHLMVSVLLTIDGRDILLDAPTALAMADALTSSARIVIGRSEPSQ